MKEYIVAVIALLLLSVGEGMRGQPSNEYKYTSLREMLLSQDELTNMQEVLSDEEDKLTDIQRLETQIQRSNQLLKTFCRFLLKTKPLSKILPHCIRLQKYIQNENYILQSIILKMKKYYKIEGYTLLDKFLKLRHQRLHYLSTEDLENLDRKQLKKCVRNKIYLLNLHTQEDKVEMAANEREIDDFILKSETELSNYYKQELLLFNNVKSFVAETNEQPSKNLFNEEDFISIIYVTWSIFWMSMHFRVCSIYSNISDNFHHKDMCESYFEAMMLAFNSFKGEINDYYQETFSDIPPSITTNETDIQFAIHELLKLSLDFVLNENILMKKEPDSYESGIIKYNEIESTEFGGVEYKTIFPFDLTIEEFTEIKQLDEDPITIEDIYYAFNQKISKVIDGTKAEKIEHFFMEKIFGNEENLIHTKEIIWFNPSYFETKLWETLEEQSVEIDISDSVWKVKMNVISLIEWIKERDRYLFSRHISIWRSHRNGTENLFHF